MKSRRPPTDRVGTGGRDAAQVAANGRRNITVESNVAYQIREPRRRLTHP